MVDAKARPHDAHLRAAHDDEAARPCPININDDLAGALDLRNVERHCHKVARGWRLGAAGSLGSRPRRRVLPVDDVDDVLAHLLGRLFPPLQPLVAVAEIPDGPHRHRRVEAAVGVEERLQRRVKRHGSPRGRREAGSRRVRGRKDVLVRPQGLPKGPEAIDECVVEHEQRVKGREGRVEEHAGASGVPVYSVVDLLEARDVAAQGELAKVAGPGQDVVLRGDGGASAMNGRRGRAHALLTTHRLYGLCVIRASAEAGNELGAGQRTVCCLIWASKRPYLPFSTAAGILPSQGALWGRWPSPNKVVGETRRLGRTGLEGSAGTWMPPAWLSRRGLAQREQRRPGATAGTGSPTQGISRKRLGHVMMASLALWGQYPPQSPLTRGPAPFHSINGTPWIPMSVNKQIRRLCRESYPRLESSPVAPRRCRAARTQGRGYTSPCPRVGQYGPARVYAKHTTEALQWPGGR
ncbi:hypothetical protein G6O67_003413 [Ophiocordyceps sinensis]|uniref:Uncharacterized protein n=1 Tax=Ophiocordyceps sinensis TaxID=72228 RepID=A0A8H4PW72_9HYPO|nr:hypothetical protein G6O67_003413 [Ophiocordyceps sinensis]